MTVDTGTSFLDIFSGCSRQANGEYLIARINHQQLALKYSCGTEVPYYWYVPEPILDSGNITLHYNRSVITDRTILDNKPGMLVVSQIERENFIAELKVT